MPGTASLCYFIVLRSSLCYGPKAGQFGQVLVSAKLHLCWCYTFADLGAFYPSFVVGARLASPHGPSKAALSPHAISTKNGIRHKKNAGTQKSSGTRKVLTPEKALAPRKALAPEKC